MVYFQKVLSAERNQPLKPWREPVKLQRNDPPKPHQDEEDPIYQSYSTHYTGTDIWVTSMNEWVFVGACKCEWERRCVYVLLDVFLCAWACACEEHNLPKRLQGTCPVGRSSLQFPQFLRRLVCAFTVCFVRFWSLSVCAVCVGHIQHNMDDVN